MVPSKNKLLPEETSYEEVLVFPFHKGSLNVESTIVPVVDIQNEDSTWESRVCLLSTPLPTDAQLSWRTASGGCSPSLSVTAPWYTVCTLSHEAEKLVALPFMKHPGATHTVQTESHRMVEIGRDL